MAAQTATIVGVNGGFGALFAQHLHDDGWALHGIDMAPAAAHPEQLASYTALPEGHPSAAVDGCFEGVNLVLLCVPTGPAFLWVEHLAPRLEPETLCVDILSVKTAITTHAEAAGFRGEYLSLHPMFAPHGSMRGRSVAAVDVQDGPRCDHLRQMIEGWGAKVVRLDADAHDRATAVVQVGVHATLVALARATEQSGVPTQMLEDLATPVSGPVFDRAARILAGNPLTYQAIQKENPYAAEMRAALVKALKELGEDGAMARMMGEIQG